MEKTKDEFPELVSRIREYGILAGEDMERLREFISGRVIRI